MSENTAQRPSASDRKYKKALSKLEFAHGAYLAAPVRSDEYTTAHRATLKAKAAKDDAWKALQCIQSRAREAMSYYMGDNLPVYMGDNLPVFREINNARYNLREMISKAEHELREAYDQAVIAAHEARVAFDAIVVAEADAKVESEVLYELFMEAFEEFKAVLYESGRSYYREASKYHEDLRSPRW